MHSNKTFIADTDTVQQLISKAVSKAINQKIPEIKQAIKEDEVYTSCEVCDILKISNGTLKNWRDKGKINYHQDGAVIRYKREDIINCLEEKRITVN